MHFYITSIVGGIFALMTVILSALVSKRRLDTKTSLVDGGDNILQRRIRAHGNFSEYAPMMLILLGLLENAAINSSIVCFVGISFLISRSLHAFALITRGKLIFISAAMLLQHATFIFCGIYLLKRFI